MKAIKNSNSSIPWTNIKNRIKFLPMFSLKNIGKERVILETFMVENDISLLGALEEEKIKCIELISPLEITSPITIENKIKVNN